MLHRLPHELRAQLKNPMGILIPDSEISKPRLIESGFGGPGLKVSVGDRTTERLRELGIDTDLSIVDGVERRAQRKSESKPQPGRGLSSPRILRARNPPGSISDESLRAASQSLTMLRADRTKGITIEIAGEEDLLALPIVAFFPKGTKVAYGQPFQGLVVLQVDDATRRSSLLLLKRMGIEHL